MTRRRPESRDCSAGFTRRSRRTRRLSLHSNAIRMASGATGASGDFEPGAWQGRSSAAPGDRELGLKDANLRPGGPHPAPLTALGTPPPRGPRGANRRRQGSELRSHRRGVLSKAPFSGRPTSTTKETFGETVDLADCVVTYGELRPQHVIREITVNSRLIR